MSILTLHQAYLTGDSPSKAGYRFMLRNLTQDSIENPVLVFTTPSLLAEAAQGNHIELIKREGSCFWLKAKNNWTWEAGATWEFDIYGLKLLPANRQSGVMEAAIETNGVRLIITVFALGKADGVESHKIVPKPLPAQSIPLRVLPWPQSVDIKAFGYLDGVLGEDDSAIAFLAQFAEVRALTNRLYPNVQNPFDAGKHAVRLGFEYCDAKDEAYEIHFAPERWLIKASGSQGMFYALVTLAHLFISSRLNHTYQVPIEGVIKDEPRFAWRGSMLDVSRHFMVLDDVHKWVDIMAWFKLNRFHFHLTDDEGWRVESKCYPQLNQIASWRGPDEPIPPQYSHLDSKYGGYYTQDDLKALVTKARKLGIEIMPEFDIPAHCFALLKAMPELTDPDEPANSYYSVQGYSNNALNPAIEATYTVLENLIAEWADIFPYAYFHVGADEVSKEAWRDSPLVQALKKSENLQTTADVQHYFLLRVQKIIEKFDKKLAGWDECALSGGVERHNSLLFAWQTEGRIQQLVNDGYKVVATPGQYYYLDMASSPDWDAIGATWAGWSDLEKTYHYEACPKGMEYAIVGLQSAIWCECIVNRETLNAMVFPRFYAIAESGWTQAELKDYNRFLNMLDYQVRF